MAQHDDATVVWIIIVRRKRTPCRSFDTQHLHCVGRDSHSLQTFSFALSGQVRGPNREWCNFVKCLVLVAGVDEIGNREKRATDGFACCPDPYQLIWLPERQGLQNHRVYDTEYRAISSDCYGQYQDHDQ